MLPGREFHVDGAAVLKACLPNDVLLNAAPDANNYFIPSLLLTVTVPIKE